LFDVGVAVVVKDVLFSDFYLDVRWWRGLRWLLARRGLAAAFLDFLTKEKRTINQKANQSLNQEQSIKKANQSLNQEQSLKKGHPK
jgi:hypothetical protein